MNHNRIWLCEQGGANEMKVCIKDIGIKRWKDLVLQEEEEEGFRVGWGGDNPLHQGVVDPQQPGM